MYAGMADIAALTGDTAYVKAIDKIWENIVSKKYYLTGGVGARHAKLEIWLSGHRHFI